MIHFVISTHNGRKIAVAAPEGAVMFKVASLLQTHYGCNVAILQFISELEHSGYRDKITLGEEVL
jgi:hypothetical protein